MIYYVSKQLEAVELEFPIVTLDKVIEYFKDKQIIEVDTETEYCKWNGERLPDPYTSKALSLQLGDTENQFVIDLSTILDISSLKSLFEDSSKIKIFCNAFFDLRYFHHWKIKVKNIWDIFLVESCIHKGKNLPKGYRSLKGMSERYLGIDRDKTIRGQIHWRGLDSKVITYAAEDVAFMSLIREKQLEVINNLPVNIIKYVDLENRYVYDLSLMSYNGIYVSPEKWMQVNIANKAKLIQLREDMQNWIIENNLNKFIDFTLFGKEVSINWNSAKQVIPLLKELGVDVLVRDKDKGGNAMKESVDIKHLKKQTKISSFLPIYIEYKELEKEISTYGETFLKENINPVSRRIHSEFFQILETSRISSNNPNLQNIKSTDREGNTHGLRKAFIPQSPDKCLIDCDFSQQEPRVTADFCQDPVLLDFVLHGDADSHSFVASLISEKLLGTPIKCNKENNPMVESYGRKLRDIGKMINLGLDYGKTAFTLKDDLKCTVEAAQELLDFLKSRTPMKEEYFKKCRAFTKHHGYIISDNTLNCITYFDNFERYLELKNKGNKNKEERSEFYKIEGAIERFSQNNRIQNTGAIMSKTAHILINNAIEERGWEDRVKVVNMVHDECLVESDNTLAKEFSKIMSECMVKAGTFYCHTIPMRADPCIADYWKH